MNRLSNVHLGQLVETRMKEIGMSGSELARRLGTSRSNMTSLLGRDDLYVKQLYNLGAALEADFFGILQKLVSMDVKLSNHLDGWDISKLSEDLEKTQQELTILQEKVEFLQEINQLQKEQIAQCKGDLNDARSKLSNLNT